MNAALLSSGRGNWRTPAATYAALDAEFGFTLDPCPSDETFELREDGLRMSWAGKRVFLNPPYRELKRWIPKAYLETRSGCPLAVCLIPSRTDTSWWHDYCLKADEVRFIRGRLRFDDSGNSAPFPSAIVVFRSTGEGTETG